MLPPLTVTDAKRDFFSPRKRNQTPRPIDTEVTSSEPSLVTHLSLIPREFFVVERNSVLPVTQFPPGVYQSSFTGGEGGLWETIVFPALAPQTRQQVLFLRQTLEKLREALLRAFAAEEATPSTPSSGIGSQRRRDRVQNALVEYSKQEARIYSVCFHELIRQVKFICKEQSELLHEVRDRYDAIIGRLADRVQQLDDEVSHRTQRISELESKSADLEHANAALQRENAVKTKTIADLEMYARTHVTHSEYDSEEDDEEAQEAKWQQQRRQLASIDTVVSSKKRRDSLVEENLAAARVQTAFHKFQMRKAQHALALRVEKNVAVLDIQRSYRGFRDRQRMLHHRAVLQTIMKRRQQIAAVELLQENARAYLLKRRHSLAARHKASAVTPVVVVASGTASALTSAADEHVTTLNHLTPISESADEIARQSMAVEDTNSSHSLLRRILMTSGELMTAVRQLQSRSQRGGIPDLKLNPDASAQAAAGIAMDDAATTSSDLIVDRSVDTPVSTSSLSEDDEAKLLRLALQQTRGLVLSLEEALASSCSSDTAISAGDHADTCVAPLPSHNVDTVAQETLVVTKMAASTSTSSLDHASAAPSKEVGSEALELRERQDIPSKPTTPPVEQNETQAGHDENGSQDLPDACNSAFHLDDSLWRSATYYASTSPASDAEAQRRLLDYVSSREQRKKLVQLKQFMSDIYDTIVGRMRELPPWQLADAIRLQAGLALSCDEWQQQRRLVLQSVTDDQGFARLLAAAIPIDLAEMSREHFRCQLGLTSLVEAAMQDLHTSAACFASVDPDVETFRGFLTHERAHDELEFRCLCRYLCAQGRTLQRSNVTSALQVARLLFRVDEQEALVSSDARHVEVDNAVYRQYLPESGYRQCEEIVSTYFAAATDDVSPSIPSSPSATAVAPPRSVMASLARPTNCSQFHAKQYNSTASRSPLVRRQHQQQAARPHDSSPQPSQFGASLSDAGKWVYFDDLLALLLKYRAEMHHFHLFLHWTAELFTLSLDPAASSSSSAPLISERAFAAALTPLSVGPSDRELRNLFHNALRQRHLRLHMPLRTFTSVALLLVENRMISVSKYAPLDQQRRARSAGLRALLETYAPGDSNGQSDDCAHAWRVLATQWRSREAAFEDAIEALFQTGGRDGHRRVLRLLQLRNELYDLLAGRSASALLRGHEVYEELVDGVEFREQDHDGDGTQRSGDGVPTGEPIEDEDDGEEEDGDWATETGSYRGESPWPTADSHQSTCDD